MEMTSSSGWGEEMRARLGKMSSAARLRAVGLRARDRVLAEHTAAHRARELEGFVEEAIAREARASA